MLARFLVNRFETVSSSKTRQDVEVIKVYGWELF